MNRVEMLKFAPVEFGRLPAGMLAEDYAILASLEREGLVEMSSRIIKQHGSDFEQTLWRKARPKTVD